MPSSLRSPSGIARLVRERRSIRSFDPRPIEPPLMLELLQAAADAQALECSDPACRFLLIVSPEGKAKTASLLMDAYAEQNLFKWLPDKLNRFMANRIAQIPAFLIAIAKAPDGASSRERNFAATCALLQSFSLLARERGIGLVWNTDSYVYNPSFASGIGLHEGERLVSILYMGYFGKMPKARPRTPAANKIAYLS